MAKKFVLAIVSSGAEKLTAGGIILSGAVAQDMECKVFLLLGGAYGFRKDFAEGHKEVGDANLKTEEFQEGLKRANVPHWLDFYKKAKEMGNVKFYLCGTAGKIWKSADKEDFHLVDEVCGIGEYISASEEADITLLI